MRTADVELNYFAQLFHTCIYQRDYIRLARNNAYLVVPSSSIFSVLLNRLKFFYFGVYQDCTIKVKIMSGGYPKKVLCSSLKTLIKNFHNIRWILLFLSLLILLWFRFPFPFIFVSGSDFVLCLYFLFQVTHVIVIISFFFT